jgi:lipid II isoglutaminyl synthase (glutamine-hydrolysing)
VSDSPLSISPLALLAGKVSAKTIRLLNAGMGSNLPGRLARQISPQILSELSSQARLGALAVTGTNGKSTTTGLLSSILKMAGFKLIHNRQGANLVTGITASLIDAADWKGRIDADYGLFEIDEAALPIVAREIKLNAVVVTNLFRDQLDRFGELDTTARLIAKGISENNAAAILNADDPNVSQLASQGERLYYGIELGANAESPDKQLAELSYCTECASEIAYKSITYGQLGNWYCPQCNHRRPPLSVYASEIILSPSSSTFVLHREFFSLAVELKLPGLFNIYNAVAAAAAATRLGVSLETIKEGLKEYATLFGRSELINLDGKKVLIQLIKNPAGASQTIQAVTASKTANVLIAINDNLADGRDISWLWDADFEHLRGLDGTFVVSGQRAEDMALRLKYAGLEISKISCIPSLDEALKQSLSRTNVDSLLWILPTYTCLLDLQKIFKKIGVNLSGT